MNTSTLLFCLVIGWFDADTPRCAGWEPEAVRIANIEHPEKSETCIAAAKARRAAIPVMEEITGRIVKAHHLYRDRYGRIVATITMPDGRDFGSALIAANAALPWPWTPDGRRALVDRPQWCQ